MTQKASQREGIDRKKRHGCKSSKEKFEEDFNDDVEDIVERG